MAGEKGEYIRKRFGIKTDMDIRSDEECRGMTGSLAYILCGLLGANENFLALDWEISGFWARGVGFCHEKRYDKLVDGFKKNHPAPTTCERLEKYVLSLGFTRDDIEKFRSIMFEDR